MMSCKIQRTRFMQGYTVHAYIQKATGPGDWKLQIVLDCLQKVREIFKKNNLGFFVAFDTKTIFFCSIEPPISKTNFTLGPIEKCNCFVLLSWFTFSMN